MKGREKVPKPRFSSEEELIEWLSRPVNSLNPSSYIHELPSGLVYISQRKGKNCVDYALGCRGIYELEIDSLIPCAPEAGCLIVYFYGANFRNWLHAGIYLGGDAVESQWGTGAVFRHKILQIPRIYGRNYRFYERDWLSD